MTSRFSSDSSSASSGGAAWLSACEPQQDRRQGLVDLVVQVAREPAALLLLGAQHEPPAAQPLLLDAPEQAAEGRRQTIHLLERLTIVRSLERGRLGRVDRLDALDQPLER